MQPEIEKIRPSLNGTEWHEPSCFGCGSENPHGLHAEFLFNEETGEVQFDYKSKGFETGAPGYFHGGVLATLMDEAQGVLCFHVGHMIMTDRLYMKYHKASAIGGVLKIRCWITAVRKRRMYTRGTIHSVNGDLLVSTSAVWYLLPDRVVRRLIYTESMEDEFQRIRKVLELNRRRAKEIRKKIRESKEKFKKK